MATALLNHVDLHGAANPGCSRVDVRPGFGITGKAACALQGTEPTFGPMTADAGALRPAIGSAMKGYWVHTPKFGPTDHFQRWRFET